jgi:hypothetical protein
MFRPPRFTAFFITLAALSVAASATAQTPAAQPAPFLVTYEVVFRGINAGTSTLELTRENGDRWRYVSRNKARGLFRLALPGEVRQTSLLTIDSEGVRPLRYVADDGTDSTDKDVRLDFDWSAGLIRGSAEKRPVELPLQRGLQDAMSVQIALMQALMRGESPRGYTLVDEDRIKEYIYAAEGKAQLRTVAGELDTVIWASHRPNSDRVTRVWYAPSLGYLPVQAERRRGEKVEWSMRLESWRR